MSVSIRPVRPGEAGLVLELVRELAAYERLLDCVDATEQMIDAALFAPTPRVFCDIAEWERRPAGLALWFPNFSSFRGRHGIYLEDLYVRPAYRRRGIGRAQWESTFPRISSSPSAPTASRTSSSTRATVPGSTATPKRLPRQRAPIMLPARRLRESSTRGQSLD